jgi:tryptophan-rich sensory protein
MKLPGRAWLDFEVSGDHGVSHLHQTAIFDPKGLGGRVYWYLIYPLHQLIFAGMLRGIAAATRRNESPTPQRISRKLPSQVFAFLVLLLACFGTAAIGAAWTSTSIEGWYQTLAKPAWTPPDWVFGPVWTVLYLMMAIAGWLFWRRSGIVGARGAWLLFAAQLLLNALWSGIFFALRSPGLAFIEILVLWSAIAGTIVAFWPHSRWASYLLVPYLAWSSFAAVLNLAIWRLNP